MYKCESYISQDFICLIVIYYIFYVITFFAVFGFWQTLPHAFNYCIIVLYVYFGSTVHIKVYKI